MINRFYGEFDTQRRSGTGDGGDYRTPFQIDRDRVLHTPTFRRLQNKTQVFWSGEYDFYRTRLTHSLEVAQIGKSICHWLKSRPNGPLDEDFFIDPDLVEAVCLSHDLGHPPFGHAGERTLNHLMREHGGFEGNAQTLRLLTERIFSAKRCGMDPTRAFLDGVLKYKSRWSDLLTATGEAPVHHFIYDDQLALPRLGAGRPRFPVRISARRDPRPVQIHRMPGDGLGGRHRLFAQRSIRQRARRVSQPRKNRGVGGATRRPRPAEGTPLGDLMRAIRRKRVDPFVGKRIGRYIQSTRLEEAAEFPQCRDPPLPVPTRHRCGGEGGVRVVQAPRLRGGVPLPAAQTTRTQG